LIANSLVSCKSLLKQCLHWWHYWIRYFNGSVTLISTYRITSESVTMPIYTMLCCIDITICSFYITSCIPGHR
jgi:hypothetical protein